MTPLPKYYESAAAQPEKKSRNLAGNGAARRTKATSLTLSVVQSEAAERWN